jgi:hypothetical protein
MLCMANLNGSYLPFFLAHLERGFSLEHSVWTAGVKRLFGRYYSSSINRPNSKLSEERKADHSSRMKMFWMKRKHEKK